MYHSSPTWRYYCGSTVFLDNRRTRYCCAGGKPIALEDTCLPLKTTEQDRAHQHLAFIRKHSSPPNVRWELSNLPFTYDPEINNFDIPIGNRRLSIAFSINHSEHILNCLQFNQSRIFEDWHCNFMCLTAAPHLKKT